MSNKNKKYNKSEKLLIKHIVITQKYKIDFSYISVNYSIAPFHMFIVDGLSTENDWSFIFKISKK